MSSERTQPTTGDRPGCAEARLGMRAFVAGTAPANPPPAWREHMSACSRCTLEYHELVQNVARLARGAGKVASRHTDDLAGPGPEERVRRSLIAADARNRKRVPKLFLPVAAVAVLALFMTRQGVPHPILRTLAGAVTRAGVVIDSDKPVLVTRGDACATSAGSRAELGFGTSWIRFEPESSFLVDRTDKLAVRFFAGEAQVEGDALLVLPGCAVEVHNGGADLELFKNQVKIRCEHGTVMRSDGSGRFMILPGETSSVQFESSDTVSVPDAAGH